MPWAAAKENEDMTPAGAPGKLKPQGPRLQCLQKNQILGAPNTRVNGHAFKPQPHHLFPGGHGDCLPSIAMGSGHLPREVSGQNVREGEKEESSGKGNWGCWGGSPKDHCPTQPASAPCLPWLSPEGTPSLEHLGEGAVSHEPSPRAAAPRDALGRDGY